MSTLTAPFPAVGGKATVADIVWPRLGDPNKYAEPFAFSAAMLLRRPTTPRLEVINDANYYVANFWRAVKCDPDAVTAHADYPIIEADVHARHAYMVQSADAEAFRRRMADDPDYYDAKFAGWWCWGLSQWIAGAFCEYSSGRRPNRQRPGVILNGVHKNIALKTCAERTEWLTGWMRRLADRLRTVTVCCGEWRRICDSPSTLHAQAPTAVFLDPPYALSVPRLQAWIEALETGGEGPAKDAGGNRAGALYANDAAQDVDKLVAEVHWWCRQRGADPRIRIALCGYEGEHDALESLGWSVVAWKTQGGYSNQRKSGANENKYRERIWFSPACATGEVQRGLFDTNSGFAAT